jgi:hypothetical protein
MAIRRFSVASLANASGCHFGHLFFERFLGFRRMTHNAAVHLECSDIVINWRLPC